MMSMSFSRWARRPQALCSVCRGIDFQKISPPSSFALHANLEQLRKSADKCAMCHVMWGSIYDKCMWDREDWCGLGREHLYEVRLELSESHCSQGFDIALNVILLKRTPGPSNDKERDAGKHSSGSAVEGVIQRVALVFTNEGDLAADVLPWIRQVGQYTGSQENHRAGPLVDRRLPCREVSFL